MNSALKSGPHPQTLRWPMLDGATKAVYHMAEEVVKIKKQTNEQTNNNNNKATKIISNIFVVVCEKSNFSERAHFC